MIAAFADIRDPATATVAIPNLKFIICSPLREKGCKDLVREV
jgi:hypothetical protein